MHIHLLIMAVFVGELISIGGAQFTMALNRRRKQDKKLKVQMDVFGEMVSSRFENTLYEGIISVGTPLKPFKVILDTGSAMLWLPKKGCKNAGQMGEYCENDVAGTYDPGKSNTSKALHKKFTVQYGIGQTSGELYSDMFAFGDSCQKHLRLKKPVIFGAGTDISDGDQGVLGLGFERSDQKYTSIFDRAVKEGVLKDAVFTVFFKSCPAKKQECRQAGLMTFGQVDRKHCGAVIGSVPLNLFALQWEFLLEGLTAGNYTVKFKKDVITDSGASHLFLPYDVFDALAKIVGWREEKESYIVSCKRKWKISLKIGQKDYVIKSRELVSNLGKDRCDVAIRPKANEPYVLGGPFLRSYCNIHYWKDRKISFARIK